jgi:hypothetical protein
VALYEAQFSGPTKTELVSGLKPRSVSDPKPVFMRPKTEM